MEDKFLPLVIRTVDQTCN